MNLRQSTSAALISFLMLVLAGGPTFAQETADEEATVSGEVQPEEASLAATGPFVLDAPTLDAVSGLYHMTTAQLGSPMTFRLSVMGQAMSSSDVVRSGDEDTRFIGKLGMSVTVLDWLEPYGVLSARSNRNTFSVPETVLSQGDITLGAKAVYPVAKMVTLGGDLRLMALTGAGETSFDFGATSVQLMGLATFDARELPEPLPVRAHLNLGYLLDNSDQLLPEDTNGAKLIPSRVDRFAQDLNAYDQIKVGVGFDVPLEYVTPLVEYNIGILAGQEPTALCDDTQPLPCPSEAGLGSNPQTLTLGVKGSPLEGLILNGGLDIGVNTKDASGVPVTAPWNLIFGISYVFDPRPTIQIVEKEVESKVAAAPAVGFVRASVVDVDSGAPVGGALISYPNTDKTRQSTNAETGMFVSYDFPPGGSIDIEVSHPEYETTTVQQTLAEGENVARVELKPIGKSGVIAGSVLQSDGLAANTSVVLTGPKSYTVKLTDGKFSQKVLVGSYTVAAAMPGYLTAGQDVFVTVGSTSQVDLKMTKRPASAVVNIEGDKILIEGGIAFDGDKLKPKASAILDQVYAALIEHPEFTRVRIESHVDTPTRKMGKVDPQALTDARAKAVFNYLNNKGIRDDRLEAKGYGASQPLVPNLSERNRAINRRIELTIISRAKK